MDLAAAALTCLSALTGAEEALRSLYRQPDRAVYLAARSDIVLKVYSDRVLLRREWETAQIARAAGIPTPELLAFVPGPPAIIAMRHVVGQPLTSEHAAAAREAGALIAQFHRIGARPPFATGQPTWDRHILAWASRELGRLEQLAVLDGAQIARLRAHFARLLPRLAGRPIALLHGDLQPVHILVDVTGARVVAFLDFAEAQPGDPLLDLAVLTLWDEPLARPLLEGYAGIADDAETAELLADYRLLRHVSEIPWLLDRGYDTLAAKNIAAIADAIRRAD